MLNGESDLPELGSNLSSPRASASPLQVMNHFAEMGVVSESDWEATF